MKEVLEKSYIDSQNAKEKAKEALDNNKKLMIVTLNPDGIMESLKNKELYDLFMQEDTLLVCESVATRYAIKKILKKNIDVYPGIEMFEDLLNYSKDKRKKIYLYGAKEEVVSTLYNKLTNNDYIVVGYKNGYVNGDLEERKKQILKARPDLLACAMGVGKQEIFLKEIKNQSKKGVYIGVGGSFDCLSGYKKRAPKIFIKLRLEWLYRILKEPNRISKFLKKNVKFILLVLKEKNNA